MLLSLAIWHWKSAWSSSSRAINHPTVLGSSAKTRIRAFSSTSFARDAAAFADLASSILAASHATSASVQVKDDAGPFCVVINDFAVKIGNNLKLYLLLKLFEII